MKVAKIVLKMVVIAMTGSFLSSCALVGKDSDRKLYSGVKYDNLQQINEAIEEGANINKLEGIPLSESNPVRIAFNDNRGRVAEYLIKRGADANYADKNGTSLFMFKAYNMDVHFCELLLKYGAEIDKTDEIGDTALEYAVRGRSKGSTENGINRMITLLMDHGAKIRPNTLDALLKGNGTGDNGCMYGIVKRILEGLIKAGYKSGLDPLLEAAIRGDASETEVLIRAGKIKKEDELQILFHVAASGNVETLRLLEEKGLALQARDKIKNTLLITASQYGNLEMVKYLSGKGLDIEAQDQDNNTALLAAVMNNQYETVEYLIKNGAKAHMENGYSVHDALCEAAANGNVKIMKLIIDSGYPLNDENLGLAMEAAVKHNQAEALQYFLDMGADPDTEYNNCTPIEEALFHGNLDAVKLLVEKGASVNGKKIKGQALKNAAEYGTAEAVEYLIKKGADVNAVPEYGDAPKDSSSLMAAIMRGNFDTVKLLVENGADLEYKIETGDMASAIIIAARNGSRSILEYLIKKGAEINYQDQKGTTALMSAVEQGEADNVKILTKYKADINLRDKNRRTALDIAKAQKNKAVIKILQNSHP